MTTMSVVLVSKTMLMMMIKLVWCAVAAIWRRPFIATINPRNSHS